MTGFGWCGAVGDHGFDSVAQGTNELHASDLHNAILPFRNMQSKAADRDTCNGLALTEEETRTSQITLGHASPGCTYCAALRDVAACEAADTFSL